MTQIYILQEKFQAQRGRLHELFSQIEKEFEILWEASSKDLSATVFGLTNTIKTSFKSACEKAELEDFRFHDCRHTATTRMIASGSPHTEVMKITGHSQLKTFLRYLNITVETTNRVASNLDNYLAENQFSADAVSETVS